MTETKKPHYHGHRQRLRERLVQESRSLADYELLELLLGQVFARKDTKPLAKALIARFGSLKDALMARPDELTELDGIGPAVVAHWTLFQELFARVGESGARRGVVMSDPAAVAEAAMARIGNMGVEEFWCAFLDTKNRLIVWERISRGTVDATAVFPREILAKALRLEAASLIMVHNHPGGDPSPSKDDILLTGMVMEAAASLDVRVADHLIVTDREYYSFNEWGRL